MEYFAPRTIPEALAFMRKWKGKGKLIAGGTNVIPDLRAQVIRPEVLIDLCHLKNLSHIKEEKNRIRIGGLTNI